MNLLQDLISKALKNLKKTVIVNTYTITRIDLFKNTILSIRIGLFIPFIAVPIYCIL